MAQILEVAEWWLRGGIKGKIAEQSVSFFEIYLGDWIGKLDYVAYAPLFPETVVDYTSSLSSRERIFTHYKMCA